MPIFRNNCAFSPFKIFILKLSIIYYFMFHVMKKDYLSPVSHVCLVCKSAPSLNANYGNYVMNTYEYNFVHLHQNGKLVFHVSVYLKTGKLLRIAEASELD